MNPFSLMPELDVRATGRIRLTPVTRRLERQRKTWQLDRAINPEPNGTVRALPWDHGLFPSVLKLWRFRFDIR